MGLHNAAEFFMRMADLNRAWMMLVQGGASVDARLAIGAAQTRLIVDTVGADNIAATVRLTYNMGRW